ncbi:hypothetical protein EH165_05180 [Nakamurella antarctica]|uniref:VWFA domain-containing protein n=1 Tax=Nakamurella antarctica TaxID=1902245 RepID=A0A3G8ZLC5_9ACTN|nr:hypothetical protein [Nakamurella antarctica]AZI57635.1 hypothetical protein EH165_05180 [Nakamurella antarctica]
MGRHADDKRRRGIAAWPIITAVAVLVIGGALAAWILWLRSDGNTGVTAVGCASDRTVGVVTDAALAPSISEIASAYNATKPATRGACITVSVQTMESADAAGALASGWTVAAPQPSVWISDVPGDVADLASKMPSMTAGMNDKSFAYSPVVLAVKRGSVASPNTFGWVDLGTKSAGGKIALANPAKDTAAYYALQSFIANSGATTAISAADLTASKQVISSLAAVSAPSTGADAAMAALAAGNAPFSAVPVIEADLAAFNAANADPLEALYPGGPTVGTAISAIALSAPWVDATAQDGAATFIAYLLKGQATTVLQTAGFRVVDATPAAKAHGIDPSVAITTLPSAARALAFDFAAAIAGSQPVPEPAPPATTDAAPGEPSTDTTPASTESAAPSVPESAGVPILGEAASSQAPLSPAGSEPPAPTPPTGPIITLVVDASAGMSSIENGKTLMAWVQESLTGALAQNPENGFGLYSISNSAGPGYTQLVPTGEVSDTVGAVSRLDALNSAINRLAPSGARWSYAAIVEAYKQAVANAVAGRVNRVIVIVDGPDLTPSTSRASVVSAIAASAAQGKNVTLEIVGLGSDPPQAALSDIARAGGGTYTSVPVASDVPATIAPFLAG